ncbi:MAG: hypothetical protein R3F43_16945 [bacterium]
MEVETGPAPVGTVIWLHGLGADGLTSSPSCRPAPGHRAAFVFPTRPTSR